MHRRKLIAVLPCLFFMFLSAATCSAQDAKPEIEAVEKPTSLQERILGVWVLAGTPGKEVKPGPGARMKFFALGHWFITQHNPEDGKVIFHHGGTYTLDGDKYTEKIAFANESTQKYIGAVNKFTITADDGKYIQIGDGNPFSEVWLRPAK